ncbi:MAG: cytochrome c3 family protein [Myxococcota bacterium]
MRTTTLTFIGLTLAGLSAGCLDEASFGGTEDFPRKSHSLLPEVGRDDGHLGSGYVDGKAPDQPIAFPHYTHVTNLGIQCEYCHTAARKSIHGGVPSTETCMNCHRYVKKDSPEIKKVWDSWESGQPIKWAKVHDIPDFVHFAHKRHVQAGVQCTECHGQVGLQGQNLELIEAKADDGHGDGHDDGAHTDEHHDGGAAAHSGPHYTGQVMVRETTMQMGWCLDCHASHPTIDENYGEKADLRRAELKDCWTCHK